MPPCEPDVFFPHARAIIQAEDDGIVEYVCADYITVRYHDNRTDEEKLISFETEKTKGDKS